MINQTISELTELVGTKTACRAVGRSRATHYRPHRQSPAPSRSRARGAPARRPRALTEVEAFEVFAVLHSQRFVDIAPAEIHAVLLDEGV